MQTKLQAFGVDVPEKAADARVGSSLLVYAAGLSPLLPVLQGRRLVAVLLLRKEKVNPKLKSHEENATGLLRRPHSAVRFFCRIATIPVP